MEQQFLLQKIINVYKRIYENQELLVINNFYGEKTEINLDFDTTGYTNILSNSNNNRTLENKMKLEPYDSLIFYRENNIK